MRGWIVTEVTAGLSEPDYSTEIEKLESSAGRGKLSIFTGQKGYSSLGVTFSRFDTKRKKTVIEGKIGKHRSLRKNTLLDHPVCNIVDRSSVTMLSPQCLPFESPLQWQTLYDYLTHV